MAYIILERVVDTGTLSHTMIPFTYIRSGHFTWGQVKVWFGGVWCAYIICTSRCLLPPFWSSFRSIGTLILTYSSRLLFWYVLCYLCRNSIIQGISGTNEAHLEYRKQQPTLLEPNFIWEAIQCMSYIRSKVEDRCLILAPKPMGLGLGL